MGINGERKIPAKWRWACDGCSPANLAEYPFGNLFACFKAVNTIETMSKKNKNKNDMTATNCGTDGNMPKAKQVQPDEKVGQQEAACDAAEPEIEEESKEKENEEMAKQIAELEQKCAELADKNLRMMAEFNNYRQRTNKEKLELMKTAGERIFVDMLPLVDDFERAKTAMMQTDDVESVRQGINLIYDKFLSFLKKHQVEPIETEGADFDTEFHEAITTIPSPTPEQKGKVIDCTQRGYKLADKVIRYAKVVVGN